LEFRSWPFCLTFVRGRDERGVFEGFGADPDDTVAARATIPFGEIHDRPRVMVGRSGEWVFALEENIPAQGTRPEVLRRVSAGTEAVAVYNDIGKSNDEFAHAVDGEVITAVTTVIPPHWRGSEPDRLRSLAEEIALDDDGESGILRSSASRSPHRPWLGRRHGPADGVRLMAAPPDYRARPRTLPVAGSRDLRDVVEAAGQDLS
jgi:Family of unknown function (DUF6461)